VSGGVNPRVHVVTLGCARNEVDSDELAGRLAADGWDLVEDGDAADVVLVNTCGFIEAAKKDSIDTILAHADGPARVVAAGCLAERYGVHLAESLPEATVVGFDDYPSISRVLHSVLAGDTRPVHEPRDRRTLLPISPVDRAQATHDVPGHAVIPGRPRLLLGDGPVAPLKIASGCDRRCTFCAIPRFRGSFVSRPPGEVLAEAAALAADGIRELLLVSENSTSYGKDLGDLRLLERLLPELAAVDGIDRVRVSYLQPAEMRPGLVAAIAGTPGVASYFDLSFQHASATVLRRMKRFGGTADFLALLDSIRAQDPDAGVRTNVIVGFPGETDADVDELCDFLAAARLDAVGVFGYSAEDDTEAADFDGALPEHVVRERVEHVATLVDALIERRAAERVGTTVDVLLELPGSGRAAHQGPEDGVVHIQGDEAPALPVGQIVPVVVTGTEGVDLIGRLA
jgi:ribosomal protein S12 methylthiotransferase